MARTLNYSGTGGNSNVLWVFALDDAGVLTRYDGSNTTGTTSGITPNGTNTFETETNGWNGHTVLGGMNNTNNDQCARADITGATALTATGCAFICIGNTSSRSFVNTTYLRDSSGNNIINAGAAGFLGCGYLTSSAMSATPAAGVEFMFLADWTSGGTGNTWYGEAGGTGATDKPGLTIGTNPNTRSLSSIGYTGASQQAPSHFVLAGALNFVPSQGEKQAILDDPYGVFFGASSGASSGSSNRGFDRGMFRGVW